jgi:hypothetical protein
MNVDYDKKLENARFSGLQPWVYTPRGRLYNRSENR